MTVIMTVSTILDGERYALPGRAIFNTNDADEALRRSMDELEYLAPGYEIEEATV